MIFRKARISDADAVTEIYDLARQSLKRNGIPQWQGGIPGRSSFMEDVERGESYVIEDEGSIIGTIQIIEHEPYYDKMLTGEWRSESALVAHRVAVLVGCRKRGVGSMLLLEAEKIAVSMGKSALRLDTHENNFKMRNMLKKNGYVNVGAVKMPNGELRLAYEKLL